MKFLLVEDKKKGNYLVEGATQEVDSLGNPLTPEQVKFFANSKVRDNKGNLLVCYHGTNVKVTEFKHIGKSVQLGADLGYWFTDNKNVAINFSNVPNVAEVENKLKARHDLENTYANKLYDLLSSVTNLTQFTPEEVIVCCSFMDVDKFLKKYGAKKVNTTVLKQAEQIVNDYCNIDDSKLQYKTTSIPTLVTAYLNITNLKILKGEDVGINWTRYNEIISAIEEGYDGVLIKNGDTGKGIVDEYIVFSSNQIKSITNTNPTNSNNINEDISLQDKHAVREFADECKVDGLPLMDYKEFSELLNEQGMKPNEELYQVYVDAYNNEEDTDYIEVIRKEFEKMSSNEIIDLLGIPNSSNIDSDSPMFLLPNGSIISVAQAGKLNNIVLSDSVHADMLYVIFTKIGEKHGIDYGDYIGDIDENDYLNILTYGKDWARVNCGETWMEERFYCVLPNHMTSAQYRNLEKWLEWGVDTGKKEVLVYVGSYQDNNTYSFKDNLPEDIIKKIKRYYSSGRLYEDIWDKNGIKYQPKQDSKYKRLILKPINTLTQEEIKYIFTIHWCWYLSQTRRFDYIEDALEEVSERFDDSYFKECYDFFQTLSFPLKIYRAIRDSELSGDKFNIDGKHSSYSWTTNINIYKDNTSKFRNCIKIVSCEIDSNIIDVANTINNFIFYTSSHHTRGYGEYEITLKQYFSQSALRGLQFIDKNEVVESMCSGILENRNELKENMRESLNTFNKGIDGWDNRTGVIKRIDKYLSSNPKATPPKGYIEKHSRAYDDAVSRYGDYVTTSFGNISTDDLMQYARDNKLLGESNELEQRAKKHKKKSKGLGWYPGANFNSNAGDVEKGIEVFNNSTSLGTIGGEGTAMGEAIKNNTNTYFYYGPIYYRGNKISNKSSIYTSAPTVNIAARNILFRAANGAADFYNYDIDDSKIKMIKSSEQPKSISKREICSHCGYELNDMGECPVCDYGEYDLLDEGLSSLEALWTLHRNLDD